MAPSQSKAEQKTCRKKKSSSPSQKKKKHAEEFKRQRKRLKKRKSNEEINSDYRLSNKDGDDLSLQSLTKSEKDLTKLQGERRRSGFKEIKEKRQSREDHSERSYGEPITYLGEKTKGRTQRPKYQSSEQLHNIIVKSYKPRGVEDHEKYALKKEDKGLAGKYKTAPDAESFRTESEEDFSWKQESCQRRNYNKTGKQSKWVAHTNSGKRCNRKNKEGKATKAKKSGKTFSKATPVNSEDSSCLDSQEECRWNQRSGNKGTGKAKFKSTEKKSFLEDNLGEKWQPASTESEFAGERRSYRTSQKTIRQREEKPEIKKKKKEFQTKGNYFKRDEKIKRKDRSSVTGIAPLGDSHEQTDDESSPENYSGSHTEDERDSWNHGHPPEHGRGEEESNYEENRCGSEDTVNVISSIGGKSGMNQVTAFLDVTRSKFHNVSLNRPLQESTIVEENASVRDQMASVQSTTSQLVKGRSQAPNKFDAAKQSSRLEEQSNQAGRTRVDGVALLAKRYTHPNSQPQILLKVDSQHAKTKLLAISKLFSPRKETEIGSELEETESIHFEKNTRKNKTLSRLKMKECSAEKKDADGEKIGKVKTVAHQTLGRKEEIAWEQTTGEQQLIFKQPRHKSLQTISAFKKVTHWLSQKPHKKASLKHRFLKVVRAVGISEWFSKRFGKRMRNSQPYGFRRRMAIRIVNLAEMAKKCNKTSIRQHRRKDLDIKEYSCSSSNCDQISNEGTLIEKDEQEGRTSDDLFKEAIFSWMKSSELSEEEKNHITDNKFAIVFPQVHQLVNSKNVSHGISRNKGKRNTQGFPCSFQADEPILMEEKRSQGSSPRHFEEEDMGDLIQRTEPETTEQLHWTQHQPLTCDPTTWLNSEMLLPRLTIENLSKWTLYKEKGPVQSHKSKKSLLERWEAEDVTEDTLQKDMAQKQVYKDGYCYTELEKTEDLSRLEEACESSVLLCLKKRFHQDVIYTYVGHILISMNPFKALNLYSEDVIIQYQKGMLSRNAPHIFAIAEMAYAFSQSSEKEQCIVISGQSGSGKSEAVKVIILYFSRLYQQQECHGGKQPSNVLPILESFGNAKTVLNDNSSRLGKFLHFHLRHGFIVGTSISQYLLEKSRVVFQGCHERSFHIFYELLAGLSIEQKEELYLQEPETYFYLNQGRTCKVSGKHDDQDFLVLIKALQVIGLSEDQLSSIWAVLAGILQLGNICFTSFEKESFELVVIPSETEIQIVAKLLHVSADLLQRAITHRVTETHYDQILSPLSVESAIDARDSIAKILYSQLFDWLLMKINEWLAPLEMDSTVGIVDMHGFENLGMNSLEQLCINFANERLQHFFHQRVVTQEEEEYTQENLLWSPVSKRPSELCLDLVAAKPHGILQILDEQTLLSQATDHTFLQKCHYHHANNRCYVKPNLPLPIFTVQHYAGPVTYQVHKFLNKNHNQLRPDVLDIFSHSHLKLVSSLFQNVGGQQVNQRESKSRVQRLKHRASTLVSRFQQSLQDIIAKLDRSHVFFVQCIKPNSKKVPDIFDTEFVACQLRHLGILEAICLHKGGYPIHLSFHHFLTRYGVLAGQGPSCMQKRDGCAAVLSHVVGDISKLYQIGITKVFLKEKTWQMLEKQRNKKLTWAIVTLQRYLRGLINRRQFQVFRQKITVIQAHFRGHLARKRYQRLKKTLLHFGVAVLVSGNLVHKMRECKRSEDRRQRNKSLIKSTEGSRSCLEMDVRRLEIPAELAALLRLAQDHNPAQDNQVTEVSLPEVKAKATFSLPPDINNFLFSTFVKNHFQVVSFPALGQPLREPLTQLQAEHRQNALQLNKLILRFISDGDLQGVHKQLLGNYIASRGLASLPLRNELLSQVATQLWKNPDLEQCQQGWVLMATLLSAFTPSPALEKPLLKFVSDHALEGYDGMCQRKLLTSMKQTEGCLELSRSFPPTHLEWTANQRKGKMVLEVCTYKEERISAEVESWTTGEQYAGWILNSRGLDTVPRGWSVSMFTGNKWQDLAGCDFVLDLIGEMEEENCPSQSSSHYPIIPERDVSYSQNNSPNRMSLDIPPAPTFKAPSFPPPALPPMFHKAVHPDIMDSPTPVRELDHYVDGLFKPLLNAGSRSHMSDMESEASLTGRMKGGGKIGPMNQGAYSGYPGMMTMPAFPSMPVMGGMMPATMPGMPAMMMTQPMMPTVDPNQAAAQQQSVINQQALFLAQQMTLQAMKISEQDQQRQQKYRSLENSHSDQLFSHRSHEYSRPRQASPHSSPKLSRPRRASPKRRTPEHLRRRRSSSSSSSESSPEASRSRRISLRKRSSEASRSRRISPKSRSPEPSSPKETLLLKRSPELSRSRKVSTKEQPSESSRPIQDSPPPPHPPRSPIRILEDDVPVDIRMDSLSQGTFQKKVEFFQRMGIETIPLKKVNSKSHRTKEKSEDPGANQESNSDLPLPAQLENYQERKFQNTKPEQPEPSQEIRNIIKNHKKRPVPPPKPIMPVRDIPKSLTKCEPKDEALAKLETLGLDHSSVPSEKIKPSPPSPAAKPSNTIKEKQLALANIFNPHGSVLPPPPPGPPPPPFSPPDFVTDETTGTKDSAKTVLEDTNVKTQLFNLSASVSFSYANPTWKLFLRKEVFYPRENFSHPYCLNLLCDQILRDTYSESCIRISKEERRKMKDLLAKFHVGMDVSSITEEGIKKRIVVAARDNWASYFSRLFPVKGENGSDVQILGVSHRGLQLLKKSKEASFNPEHLKILCSFSYADVLSLELISRNVLQFSLKNEQLILHSQKAQQIKATVEIFLKELKQESNYVIAMRNYVTDDKSLLNFKKGDFIRLLPMKGLEPGWQFGSIGGRSGLFPSAMVQVVAAPDYLNLHMNQQEEVRTGWKKNTQERITNKENSAPSTESEVTRPSTPVNSLDICHYTMTEFAMAHFREAQFMLGWKGMGVEQMDPALLVQHTKVPIREALLFHSDDELNNLATKNFLTLMRFMGDQPGLKKEDQMDYIYEILQLCKEKKTLHDEVYCQVIKQITENPNLDSCHHGWQLLSLLTGYFLPSSTLMPYITQFLQQICYDSTHHCSGLVQDCQSNLRKLIVYGGRQHLPFLAEMNAFLKGHCFRRMSILLPGGLHYNAKIKTFDVTVDVLKQICKHIGVTELEEIQEFAILASKDKGKMIRPLHQEEYVHDYLLDESSIGLSFCRITWKIPLHLDNEVYINFHYNQVLQNYMTGSLSLQHTSKLGQQLGALTLLQHWARGTKSVPTREELKNYIPVSINISPDIVEIAMAYQLETIEPLEPLQAQIGFIEHVIQLPLFGYNVFSAERTSAPDIPSPCIVGVNQEEIVVMSRETQSNQIIIPLNQILRMKTLCQLSTAGLPGVEINYGSVENPKTIWFELQQAKALYHLIIIIGNKSDSQA